MAEHVGVGAFELGPALQAVEERVAADDGEDVVVVSCRTRSAW